jgi:hypothetical protein
LVKKPNFQVISTQENLHFNLKKPHKHPYNTHKPFHQTPNTQKNGPKTQNQIDLVLALKSHVWFFMQHRDSKQIP